MNKPNHWADTYRTLTWQDSAQSCVLCYLATTDEEGMPNVSPKEIFAPIDAHHLIIADIASPQSIKNLRQQSQCAVALVHIFYQWGHQIKGRAEIIDQEDCRFVSLAEPLLAKTQGRFAVPRLINVHIETVKPILAPSYLFYRDTTPQAQYESALQTYGVSR